MRGIFTPFAVPITDGGALNEAELRRYLRWLLAQGVDGLYPNGSTGEFIRLSLAERRRVATIAVEEAGGYSIILAGAAEATLHETLESCEYYAALQCDAVSLCPPYYFKLSQDAIIDFFRNVARMSPLPVFIYQIPSFSNAMTSATILALAEEPNIIGMKDSSRDFPTFISLLHEIGKRRPGFVCFTGTEEMLFPSLMMGADGAAIAVSGVVPEVVISLYRAWTAGDYERSRELQYKLLPLIAAMHAHDFPAGFRAGVAARGFAIGAGRQPLSNRQVAELREAVPRLAEMMEGLGVTAKIQ